MKNSFNIQELLHRKSKCHGTKPMHPSSLRAFQKHQEHNLKHLNLVDFIITKQNKLNLLIILWCMMPIIIYIFNITHKIQLNYQYNYVNLITYLYHLSKLHMLNVN